MSVVRDHAMSIGFAVMAAATIGCATSSHSFPSTPGDPRTVIGRATTAIDAAASAGADTLAAEVMRAARQHLADAQIELRDKHHDRAGLRARQATADALYAKAQAERIMAERARDTEQAQLERIPAVPASSSPKTAAAAPPSGEP
jgi:Domain of unknown function (DUF4398)